MHTSQPARWWNRPRATRGVFVALLVVCLPALWNGLELDDLMMWSMSEDAGGGLSSYFAFIDPTRPHHLPEHSRPWWAHPELRFSFARPVAALTHAFDFWAWPRSPMAMHAHSIAWYLLLVALLGVLYRSMADHGRAVLAMAIFGLSQAHAMNVGWLSARNALIAAVFVVAMIWSHQRGRGPKRDMLARMGPVFFAMALAANEGGVAGLGYLVADTLVFARTRRGWLRLVPYALVLVLWRCLYVQHGFGAAHSGIYLDPMGEPMAFVGRTLVHGGLLLAARMGLAFLDPLGALPDLYLPAFIGGAAFIGVLVWLIRSRLRDEPQVRMMALGMLLACGTAGATLPIDRGLWVLSIGGSFVLADVIAWGLDDRQRRHRILARTLVGIHLVASPLLFSGRVRSSALVQGQVETIMKGIEALPGQPATPVFCLQAPSDLVMLYTEAAQRWRGLEEPRPVQYLYAGLGAVVVSRIDARTVELTSDVPWLNAPLDQMMRVAPLPTGTSSSTPWFTARVTRTDERGRPLAVEFEFESETFLEAATFARWDDGAPRFVTLPSPGDRLDLPGIEPAF